uniref:Uncharacterized protein n=1 Tax=Salmonella enterica subsp. enterica serovar London TaxID=149390 RepID=A0A3G8EVG0_SALET|nr:hypothetical protein KADIGFNM_00166 [Salmonella enterica subsp. enterica serovar London]AZF85670.1 hypothetical protein KADIGFNM_00333 [Salmonella enterica subsp. enterica serovar London]
MKKLFAALALAAVVAPCGPPPRPSRCPCLAALLNKSDFG